jgi:hypothetical protein
MPVLMATAEYVTKVHAVRALELEILQIIVFKTDNDKLVMLRVKPKNNEPCRAAYYHGCGKIRIKK